MVEELKKDIVYIKISLAKIEQHLKDMNGSMSRHEREIDAINAQVDRNSINISRMLGMMAAAGGVGGVVGVVIASLL